MCHKTVYYNTYGDGSEDVTERVDTCRPGKMCAYPELREYRRQFRFAKLGGLASPETPSSLADRRPTPYATSADYLDLPPTPRSKSPSPAVAPRGGGGKHESGVYINGEKVASIGRSGRERRRDRDRVVVHAPEPPSPIHPSSRPGLKRHSILPADYVVIENEAVSRRSSRRNGKHHSSPSKDIPLGPVRLFDDMGDNSRHSSPSRRSASPQPPTTHSREHARNARGYDYLGSERAERRKSRRSSVAHVYRPEDHEQDNVYVTPAASPLPRKEVHFTSDTDPVRDSIRRLQNERIARRPKLHQEVKSILKKDGATAKSQDVKVEQERRKDSYDELRRAVGEMDIHHPSSGTMPPLSVRREYSDPQYWERLRDRFEEPRERRRKSRVYYPDEGFYKYM